MALTGAVTPPSSPEDRANEAAHVAELLFRFMKRARRVMDDALADSELNLPRAKILGALASGDCPQGALAGAFDLAPRTVTELVDGLEKRGFVERHVDPTDRRVRRVRITESGHRAHEHARAVRAEMLERIFGALGPDELAALGAALAHLDQELDGVAGTDPPPPG